MDGDEWAILKRLFDDANLDAYASLQRARRAFDDLVRSLAGEIPGDMGMALRAQAESARIQLEDIVERYSALGRRLNELREAGEL